MRDPGFRRLDVEGVAVETLRGQPFLSISPAVLEQLAAEAFHDLSYYLRADHLDELAAVTADEAASENERFVCRSLVRNAVIAAEGLLPLCQDTGTATVYAWRGERVLTGGTDVASLEQGIARAWQENFLRSSQVAATSMFEEQDTGTNLPAQIDLSSVPGDEYRFLFVAKGGGSSNKTVLHQGSRAMLSEGPFMAFLEQRIRDLGVAACPPYTLVVVVGGTSPEKNLETLKLASTGFLDHLPTEGDGSGRPFRVPEWEHRVLEVASRSGWGAQFGGRHLATAARVIRLPRHAGSCPVSIGVSCSAHRNMLGHITAEGAFLEELDRNPSRLLANLGSEELGGEPIDLDRPMPEVLAQLGRHRVGTLLRLDGTLVVARDIAHARLHRMIQDGSPVPEYLCRHPVYYAGPARTPPGHAIGSFGPTTAQRMDGYMDFFMSRGASLVTLAKGNRAPSVVEACSRHGGFYLGTIGGAAALIARENILESEVIDFPELGMEAVHRIRVKDLPAFLLYDHLGNQLY